MFICSGSTRGIELRRVTYEGTDLTVGDPIQLIPDCRCFTFSPECNFVAFYTRSGLQSAEFPDKVVHICRFDTNSGAFVEVNTVDVPNIVRVQFSPHGTFFALVLRKNSVTDAENIPLVQIYRTGGPLIRSFNYSNNGCELFWSDNERIFAFSYSNGVKFYEAGADGTEKESVCELPQLRACAFSCSRDIVRFGVIHGTEPKRMKLFEYPRLDTPIAQQAIVVGETFSIVMSPAGQSAVGIATKNSDETYFGESFAHYLNTQGQKKMTLKKRGPIHCIEYSPGGDKFVSIAGHVPPAVGLHFEKVGTVFDFGEMSVNSARWSSAPNIVAVGGFGSLTGDLKVIDSQTRKVIACGEAPYTSAWSWSPCGRLILTAVLYPKMQVSNEIRIHNHVCKVIASIKMTELTQCEWVGVKDPKPFPKIVVASTAPPPQAAYVPPHLRAAGGGGGPRGAVSSSGGPPGFDK